MREGSDNWDNGFREEPANVFVSSVYMNVIYGWFFYNLFIWIEYMDVFFIFYWYEWNMWMLSVLFVCMNGIRDVGMAESSQINFAAVD